MKKPVPLIVLMGALPMLAAAQDEPDPFAFLAEDTRPIATRHAVDYHGDVRVGADYTSEDNYTFGEYNGRDREGMKLDLDTDIRSWETTGWLGGLADHWTVWGQDLASDVRQARIGIGRAGDWNLALGYDQQLQVKNDTGRTPFLGGGENLTLPDGWVASNLTSGMTLLTSSSRELEQELERKRFDVSFSKQLGPPWNLTAALSTETKTGTQTLGGAFYVNGSNGHAAVLPKDVDTTTSHASLGGGYTTSRLTVDLEYFYSNFDNHNDALTWANPYGPVFGPAVDYPEGRGSAAYEPDNEMQRLRGLASYVFAPNLRLTLDGSYAKTEQNQSFRPFTVNDVPVAEPVPRTDLDGEVETRTFDGRLWYRPLPKLSLEADYHFEERDNQGPRNGYLYVRGDAWAPDDTKFTVYNTAHDRTINRFGLEGNYRLAGATRLSLGYAYDEVERSNAAVEKTEEDQYFARLSSVYGALSGRLEVAYGDRAANTYEWAQSYYALLDTTLINETPDNERYITHPELSQFYLANREQWQTKLNLTWSSSSFWSASFDGSYQDADFDKSSLGVTKQKLTNATLGGQWTPTERSSVSVFYSYDRYEVEQGGRSFRGGPEKDAFAVTPPLPQASDPARNWIVKPEDTTHSIGVDAEWTTLGDRLDLRLSYHYSDSKGTEDFTTFGAPDILGTPLPDTDSTLHDVALAATYHVTDAWSIEAEYRYYGYELDDWALEGVELDTLDKVISLGEQNPDDDVSFLMLSVTYRLRE